MSDQMIDRMQESATKKERIAKQNEERMKRHEEGYVSEDSNDKPGKTKFAG